MPTTPLVCSAHQRPIGQGGFYSATLQLHGRDAYTFVYDCGSLSGENRLSDEIEEFGRELGHRPLDLLVLSHLDADHVNGVDQLLRTTHGVKDVFLPYLSPLERLIYVARYPGQSEDYYNLLADPVARLRELGAENVYLVGEGNEGNDDNISGQNDPGPDFLERLKDLPQLELETARLVRNKKIDAAHLVEHGKSEAAPAKGVTDDRSMTISGLWKLRMFQKQGLRDVLEKVVAAGNYDRVPASETKDERRCRELLREIQKLLGSKPITNQAILENIRTEVGRKAMRSAYAKVSSVHNEVSLCLWHGPLLPTGKRSRARAYGIDAISAIVGPLRNIGRYVGFDREVGTILTGDLVLKEATLDKFKIHYQHELPKTWMFQVPHHGSRHNTAFDDDLFDPDRIGFLSAGLRNSYLHPNLDLMEGLDDEYDIPVLWSNERRGVHFCIWTGM